MKDLSRGLEVLLEGTEVLLLLGRGLVGTVTELGRGIDPLELDLLGGAAGSVDEHALAESHDTLLDTGDGTLEEDEVVVDLAVADEATHTVDYKVSFRFALDRKILQHGVQNLRSDGLLGDIELGGGVACILALANTVDLVVDRGTVVVTHLTGTGNSPLDVGRVPSTDTSDLTETLVGLARKLLGSPTGGDTGETVTLGDGDAVDHLVLLEDGRDLDGLLEEAVGELDLVGNGTTVDLDLHEVGLLLLERSLADLGVGQDADDGAVLLDALEVAGDGLAVVLGVLLGVLGEGLLLGLVPVLVEAALDLVVEVLSPDGGQ